MIHINDRQISLVVDLRRKQFRDRTTCFVMATFAQLCHGLAREQVAAEVATLESCGIASGITGKKELSRYIGYHFLVREAMAGIDARDWIATIVNGPGSAMTRMRRLDLAVRRLLEQGDAAGPAA